MYTLTYQCLICTILRMKTDEQFLLEEKYDGEKTEAFFTDCKALALGEPLAYLIGTTPFLDTTIHLDGRPLIPRVETEFWVEKAIAEILALQERQPNLGVSGDSVAPQILDLCAGSGCVGVAVAQAIKEASIISGNLIWLSLEVQQE